MPDAYLLLDSGGLEKLEQLGPFRVIRPCPQAVWPRTLDRREWEQVDAVYVRHSGGGGKWRMDRRLPEQWELAWGGLPWIVKATGFGHLGLFPEQLDNWAWLEQACSRLPAGAETLNLFAYTGGSTLAMARGGVQVTHTDAARGIVSWARQNQELQGGDPNRVRWIVEDVMRFCHREQRRGHRYHGIVLDPPTFGRGPGKEFWKIEDDLAELLSVCAELLVDHGPRFVLASCHSPGFTPAVLENVVRACLGPAGRSEALEMLVPAAGEALPLPSGVAVRCSW
jgi:23S rRNA (cytosine1962-C5)-methyltransferase